MKIGCVNGKGDRRKVMWRAFIALSLVFAIVMAGLSQIAWANPDAGEMPPEKTVWITQDGNGDADTDGDGLGEDAMISAEEFTALLNSDLVDTADTVYVLREDISIKASALRDDYFQLVDDHIAYRNFVFRGSMEGRQLASGKYPTITIDTTGISGTARTLFGHINHEAYAPDLYMKNFNVTYTGDVGCSAFARGGIENTNVTNVNVEVKGDIVAEHNALMATGVSTDKFINAAGFARVFDGYEYKYRQRFPDAADSLWFKDIRVKARNIGNTEIADGKRVNSISGLVNDIYPNGVNLQDIYVDYENMYLTTNGEDSGYFPLSGIYGWMLPQSLKITPVMDNLNVNVREDMHAVFKDYNDLGITYSGVFGISAKLHTLTNSSVTVGGSMICETLDNTQSVRRDNAGVAAIGHTGWYASEGQTFSDNTATINGDMIARSRGNTYVSLGIADLFSEYPEDIQYSSENTQVTVGGNVISERIGQKLDGDNSSQSWVFGTSVLLRRSVNDHVEVKGDVKVSQEGANAGSSANFAGHSYGASHIQGGEAIYGGNVALTSDKGRCDYYGFTRADPDLTQTTITDNEMHVEEDVTLESGTEGTYAFAFGFVDSTGKNGTWQISDNRVSIGGDLKATAPKNTRAAGFAGFVYGSLKNNAVDIAGDISANGTVSVDAIGFATSAGANAQLNENTVRVGGGITAVNATDAPAYAAGFAFQTLGSLEKNAAFVKNGMTADGEGSFAILAGANSTVNKNTVIARPGVPELYENFIYSVPDGADVDGNFFTSVLDGQRVSNRLSYDSAASRFTPSEITPQKRMFVSDATTFGTSSRYIADYGDVAAADLSLFGLDAGVSSLDGANLQSNVSGHPAALGLRYKDNSVLDLPGIAHPYPGNVITGMVYQDNTDGAPTPLSGVSIRVLPQDGSDPVAIGTTNANGEYRISVPLFSALPLSYTIELVPPNDYELSDVSDNAFYAGEGKITEEIAYTDSYVYNGYLIRENMSTSDPTTPLNPPTDSTDPTVPTTSDTTAKPERPSSSNSSTSGSEKPSAPAMSTTKPEKPSSSGNGTSGQRYEPTPPTQLSASALGETHLGEEISSRPQEIYDGYNMGIAGEGMPTDPSDNGNWALVNLLLAALGVVLAIAATLRKFVHTRCRSMTWFIAAVSMAVLGALLFIITQDMTQLMTLVDRWTVVNLVIFVAEVVCAVRAFGGGKETEATVE